MKTVLILGEHDWGEKCKPKMGRGVFRRVLTADIVLGIRASGGFYILKSKDGDVSKVVPEKDLGMFLKQANEDNRG